MTTPQCLDPVMHDVWMRVCACDEPRTHEQPGQPHHFVARCVICGERGHLHVTLMPQFSGEPQPVPTQPNIVIGVPR